MTPQIVVEILNEKMQLVGGLNAKEQRKSWATCRFLMEAYH